MSLLIEQCLNGLQLGVLLFLISAGLSLVFGIMNFVNLAHGSLFMLGAFLTAWLTQVLGSYFAAAALAMLSMMAAGILLEFLLLRNFYGRHHLDHVLVTFGLVLIANEGCRKIWGASFGARPFSWKTLRFQPVAQRTRSRGFVHGPD